MPQIRKIPAGRAVIFTKEIMAAIEDRVEQAIRLSTEEVANEVRRLQQGSRTGRIYRIGKTPTKADRAAGRSFRSHQASAPGEPPGIWWGTLFNSIRTQVTRATVSLSTVGSWRGGWVGRIGTNVKYAIFLQFGTKWMKPRPLWDVAMRNAAPRIRQFWSGIGKPGRGRTP